MMHSTIDRPPYAIGTALDLPSGGTGYIVDVQQSEKQTFTIGTGLKLDRWTFTYATEHHHSELSENIAAPMVTRARGIPPLSEEEAAALYARAKAARLKARADASRRAEEAEAKRAEMAELIDAKCPAWATSAIIAELIEDKSDSMTDYFASTTTRVVVLAWSRHDRDLFPEMRKAAATFAETAHLADAPPSAEHREKYSMGGGYYLKAGYRHSSGWQVSKTRVHYLKGQYGVEFPENVTPEEAERHDETASRASRFTVSKEHNERKGFDYWLCAMAERVDRAEYDALLAQARALGGWYSRPWGKIPGGFAFKTEEAASRFVGTQTAAGDVAPAAPAPAAPVPGIAARLREMADALAPAIAGKFADRRMNTPKQQRQAAEARQDGCDLERAQAMMRAVAELHEAGTVPDVLARVRTKADFLKYAVERLDRSHCGYYDAGRATGQPASDDPAARALWELVSGRVDPEAAKAAELGARIAKLRFSNIPGYFPTPAPVVARMLEAARISGGERVLEPSAGSGAIADALRDAGCSIVCVEVNPTLCGILSDKGHDVIRSDFREVGDLGTYDAVVMNPPFERGQDLEHVARAFTCLKPGGRLVAIMGHGVMFRQDRRYSEFRDWVETNGGELESLPVGAFKESGTGVATVMLTIDREG